jgi:methylamine utilization protein MauE
MPVLVTVLTVVTALLAALVARLLELSALAGPFAIAAVLLLIGGALKAVQPGDTARALSALRLPSSPVLVRSGAMVEAAIGASALAFGDRLSASLVAVSYGAFGAFVLAAMVRGTPISSCGCFGRPDTPPTAIHVAVDAAAAVTAVGMALGSGPRLPDGLSDHPSLAILFVVVVAAGAFLVFIVLTTLSSAAAARASRSQAERPWSRSRASSRRS